MPRQTTVILISSLPIVIASGTPGSLFVWRTPAERWRRLREWASLCPSGFSFRLDASPCILEVTQILPQSLIDCDASAPLTSNTHPHDCGSRADTDYPISPLSNSLPRLFSAAMIVPSVLFLIPNPRKPCHFCPSSFTSSLFLSSDSRCLPVVPCALGQLQPRNRAHRFLTQDQDLLGLLVLSLLLPQ